MKIEVVCARSGGARVLSVSLPPGSTVGDALAASGLDLSPEKYVVGIFGRRAALDTPLSSGDRVEIYRPLAMDPKEARRRRARRARTTR